MGMQIGLLIEAENRTNLCVSCGEIIEAIIVKGLDTEFNSATNKRFCSDDL